MARPLLQFLYGSVLLAVLTAFAHHIVIAPAAAQVANTDSEALRNLIPGERTSCSLPPAAAEPLDPPTTSALSGIKQFRAGEYFREDIAPGAEVRILWIGATFMRRYAVKAESVAIHTAVRFHTLRRPSADKHIIDALGDRHEIRLADLWCVLKKQANGEEGVLLINAIPNIFYVRDSTGVLGAVDVVWGGAGWEIGASPVEGDRQWPSGARVLSR